MAEVNVSNLEAGALAGQTTRSECRKTATVSQTRQRVDLVHELRELRSSEELLDRSDDRTNIDQRLRRDCLDVLRGHALTHDTFHTAQTNANLVLDQFADAADAAVGEVVLVVESVTRLLLDQVQHVADRCEHFAAAEDVLALFGVVEQWLALGIQAAFEAKQGTDPAELFAELAVDLVPADAAEVVATALEERITEVRLR